LIALGIITALCMVVMARNVWRVADGLVGPGETDGIDGIEGPGGRGVGGGPMAPGGPKAPMDPLDRPGDGRSPHDVFLRNLTEKAAGAQPATTAPGGSPTP
jgi:hypothetical protein